MKDVIDYIKQNVDTRADFQIQSMNHVLPIYLCDNYSFFKGNLLDKEIWMIEVRKELTIDAILKHRNKLENVLQTKVVFVFQSLTRYKRKQLLDKRIPFIYGDKQIFLPFIYLDIQEMDKEKVRVQRDKFNPQTQMVFLYCMYQNKETITQKEAISELDLPVMTISRAFAILENLNILIVSKGGKTGKVKYYHIDDKKEMYQKAKLYLQSPVKEIRYMKEILEDSVLSGISALADITMLNDEKIKTIAVTDNKWREIEDVEISWDEALDGGVRVHVFQYDFNKLLLHGKMDPLSVILSIEDRDERIEMEINRMMEGYIWYED